MLYHQKADTIEKAIEYYNQRKSEIDATEKDRRSFTDWLMKNQAELLNTKRYLFPETHLSVSLSDEPFDYGDYISLYVGNDMFYSSEMNEVDVVKEIIKGIITNCSFVE